MNKGTANSVTIKDEGRIGKGQVQKEGQQHRN